MLRYQEVSCSGAGSFNVIDKINEHAYVIDLFEDFGTGSTFNVKDLMEYKGRDFILTIHCQMSLLLSLLLPLLSSILPSSVKQLDKIMNYEIVLLKMVEPDDTRFVGRKNYLLMIYELTIVIYNTGLR